MQTPKDIKENINDTFNVLDTIENVNVSPFFKDKTMQLLFSEKEEKVATGFSWFTPKLQLGTLICILIVNVFGMIQLTKSEYNEGVSEFANAYELSQETQPSLFN